MRIFLCFLFVATALVSVQAQPQRTRSGAWYFREGCSNTKVNGLGIALISGGYCDLGNRQVTNGIHLDIIGRGILPPIIYTTYEELEVFLDTLLVMQQINGLAISPGGLAFLGTVVNGINLSGLNTMTGKTNGISTGLILCYNLRVNGIAVGGINFSEKEMNGLQIGGWNKATNLRGLQIGLFNRTKNLKGVQIGLWNKSGKRALPLLNFQF